MYKYSKTHNGFYIVGVHSVAPDDCVDVTEDTYNSIMLDLNQGKVLSADDNGHPITIDNIVTIEEKVQSYVWYVQKHLNLKAEEHGYDNINTAVSYADEPSVPKFQTEGQAFRAWRSLVWDKCYQILADFEAGNISEPSPEEVIAQLPSLAI